MLDKEWKFAPVPRFPKYTVCNDGTCYGVRGKVMTPKPSYNGYLRLRVQANGNQIYLWIQRVVAEAFIAGAAGLHVHHKDHNRRHNHERNLEVITRQENIQIRNERNGWKSKANDNEVPF